MKSLKERLRDSTEFTINFQTNTISVKAKPPAVKCHTHSRPSKLFDTGSQAALPTSGPGGSNISEPVTAGPSANKKRVVIIVHVNVTTPQPFPVNVFPVISRVTNPGKPFLIYVFFRASETATQALELQRLKTHHKEWYITFI